MTDEYTRRFIGEGHYREEVTANLACRVIAVREAQRAGFGGNVRRKRWVSLRQHRKLYLSRHPKLFVHLLVLGIDLPLLILQAFNVLAQKPMLELHERAGEDHAKERALLIHEQHIFIKPFLGAEGYLFKYRGDRTLSGHN